MTLARHARPHPARSPSLVALALLLASSQAQAQDSRLPDSRYPAMSCSKPVKPFTPLDINSAAAAAQYKLVVERYNQQAQAYTACVNAYLDVAMADVQRIQQQMDAAVAAANAP
ncbi:MULTISPECIES: hypothetical protein [Hydrocarboniphaga]|uniref:UrcA family protein n=1 Tax=Hydrocarboniphaga effusa AP103 TaxID=1172194 RepID=I8TCA0_9GAMM|nr:MULTISPECIES: hypothetical protein [Hydrocarboniphaga]EIT71278.1 hypothetical protein WQQ_14150 [Hydrocarboniphaga effusa AP103]MDZ4077757.1 hypothetical protein [Hydrocarboniphaga sp.]